MAIAFARVSIHSRSKGHSAVAAASYRAGVKLVDDRTGVTHDYSLRHDVLYSEIVLPEGVDSAFTDRSFLWNQVEFAESRRDAQVCKDVVLALPKELGLVQQIELAKRFSERHFVSNGLVADISIHDHGDGNPHAHILIPTRRLEHNRFSKYKARDLNPVFAKGKIMEQDYWGEQWREFQNDYFFEQDLDMQVDANHLISERHHGRLQGSDAHYLLEEKQLIQQAREEISLNHIENIINHLSAQYSVFTRRDVERFVFKTFKQSDKPERYLQVLEQVMAHRDVIHLGQNDRKQECYTSRHHYLQEAKLLRNVESLLKRKSFSTLMSIEPLAKEYRLSEEQTEAFRFIVEGSDLVTVVGRPGAGKSYLLKPVREFYEAQGFHVLGAALSGKVAKSLQADTGIHSSTIASLSYRLAQGSFKLGSKDILIIDEAGMVDFANMAFLVNEVKKAGAKIVLVGDPDQLKPILKGEIFRGISSISGFVELENIQRQNDSGDRQASLHLAKGEIDKAIQHYEQKGAIHLAKTSETATEQLIADWQKDLANTKVKDSVLLAFTRKAVADLNHRARQVLKDTNALGQEEFIYQGFDKPLTLAKGERVLFRQNDKSLGVRNGDLGSITEINAKAFQVKLDSGESLTIPSSYQKLDYGYALTVHKSQGMTTQKAKVLIDSRYWDRHLSFVAMTRHKDSLKVYADKESHPTLSDLKRTLSRSIIKDNVIDWPLDFATRCGFDPDKLVGKVVNHLAGAAKTLKEKYHFVVDYEAKVQQRTDSELKPKTSLADEQKAFEALKKDYPILAKYDEALKKRQYLTGYWGERMDKEIAGLVNMIKENKSLSGSLKNQVPQHFTKIESQEIVKVIERE